MESENKPFTDQELTQTYMSGETKVEVYGELNTELFAELLYELIVKHGIENFLVDDEED